MRPNRLIFLKVGDDALHQLLVEALDVICSMNLNQALFKDGSVLPLKGDRKPSNNGSKNLQKLRMPEAIFRIIIYSFK